MRPRSVLSAVVIYGVGFGILFPVALWLLGLVTKAGFRLTPAEWLIVGVAAGLLFGLILGYAQGPIARTLGYEWSEDFRQRLELSLRSIGYQPHSQSSAQLTYRIPAGRGSILPVIADVTVEVNTSPVRVTGPRSMLNRLEGRLRKAGA